MDAHDVQELLDLDMLVGRAHAARERPVDIGRDVAIAPEPRIGAAQTDDRDRREALSAVTVRWRISTISPLGSHQEGALNCVSRSLASG